MLGHNMFAYCKNNVVNGRDPSGFKVVFEDEAEQRAYEQYIHAVSNSSSRSTVKNVTAAVGTTQGTAGYCTGDSIIGKAASTIVSKVTTPIDFLFSTPKIARISGGISKVGILNAAVLGLNIRDNVVNYNTWDASFRTAIDMAGFAAAIGIAAFLAPIWAPTMAGFLVGTAVSVGVGVGISTLTSWTKNSFFGKND